MPQKVVSSTENNFTKGLVTEFTGLNFPENAATDCDNVEFTLIGNVTRRLGIDFEVNASLESISRIGAAVNTYKWNNVGGDGSTQLVATQVGDTLYFWSVTDATEAAPLTNQLLASTVTISDFEALNATFDESLECQFADGNGYLFVYHPNCDPFYCTYDAGTISGTAIQVQIRDFAGVVDGLPDNTRPSTLSDEHNYNLQNQGWISGSAWSLTSTSSVLIATGSRSFTVAAGVGGISGGQPVVCEARKNGALVAWMSGTVTSYVGTTFTANITGTAPPGIPAGPYGGVDGYAWVIYPNGTGYVDDWFTSQGNYPSNADVWWRFKNASGVFDPATTQPNVSLSIGAAPKGHYIIPAFIQDRTIVSNISNLTVISTTKRPTNGCWFQGRVWYTGLNASQAATGDALFTTWTENIYFSQVVQKTEDFGKCFQVNDPTSEDLFDILPTDGGIIVIQGSGPIYRLFPIQNGLLVFAANGVWFITGSQGIGFSATDYTVTKISSVESISCTSYVDVEGLPYFWNEDGIYAVQPQQGGGLSVVSQSYSTIAGYFADIPLDSKKYARGSYDPINYTLQWIYKSEFPTDVTDRYNFDKILNYNTANKAFYPYTLDTVQGSIIGINYINSPGGSTGIPSTFKYFSSTGTAASLGFADFHDEDYADWASEEAVNFLSYFITGYRIRGEALKKFWNQYIQVWSNLDEQDHGYRIQGLWDYSTSGNSGRWTTIQNIDLGVADNFSSIYRRHKIRGSGYALQFKIQSQTGKAFDFSGWASVDTINAGT